MPPRVTRQVPPVSPTSAAHLEAGSLLGDATPVSSLREEFIKVCFYGRNRSGKTTIACQFPKPLLIISSEPDACGGATSVSNYQGVRIQRVSHKLLGQDSKGQWLDAEDERCVRRDHLRGSAKLEALAQELKGKHPFKTVVLDTATSLQELILVEIMGWDKPPAMQPNARQVGKENYQKRAEDWRKTVTHLLDLTNCHIVILCQEKDHNPVQDDFGGKSRLLGTMQQGSFMAPALGATNAQWLQDNCGYIIQIYEDELKDRITLPQVNPDGTVTEVVQEVPNGKRQRHLRLMYHPNFAAGGRWQYDRNLPECVTAPDPQGLYAAMAVYIPALKGG